MLRFLAKHRERPAIFSKRFVKVWLKRAYHFPSLLRLVAAVAVLRARGAKIGECSIIVKLQLVGDPRNLTIGSFCYIGGPIEITLQAPVSIGNNVVINSESRIFSASHDIDDPSWGLVAAPVIVEDYVWIASNSILLPGTTVGRGAVLGAGSVLRGNMPATSVFVGNPARDTMRRRREGMKYVPPQGSAAIEAWIGAPWIPRRKAENIISNE